MLDHILSTLKDEINNAHDIKAIDRIKLSYFGKNGIITLQLKNLAKLDINEKKEFGKKINVIKIQAEKIITQKLIEIREQEVFLSLQTDKLDVTLPARSKFKGSIHPISQVTEELLNIFSMFNFKIAEGPDIENDWYNFTALNIGMNHPARQMHDTFYLKNVSNNQILLRTHTSTIQIRSMEQQKPPIYLIAPGRTYRSDSDTTHTPMFHQIEGLVIDKNINMGHLKYLITSFIKMFFEQEDIEIMFRPSFFPFTEPSAEVDIKSRQNNQWLEVLGCGMVHPNVLRNVNIDPEEHQGFAFGLGIERFAMLKYNISDLRKFFENDQRWLHHYSFSVFDIPQHINKVSK